MDTEQTVDDPARLREMADSDLLLLSVRDPEVFGVLYDRHIVAVLSFFQRRTASPQDSADLAAETFARAFQMRHKYVPTESAGIAWVLGIARNELRQAARSGRVRDRARVRLGMSRIELDDESFERIEELVDFAPLRLELEEALKAMSPKIAGALLLRIGLELPYEEVARRLGCSRGTARARVSRGLTALADTLEGAR